MHRFRVRTKSDASKRSVSEAQPPASMPLPSPAPKLDSLPPESDFRTSLIMPSLSRRFTLLRGQNGEPLSIDDVRSRLAQQRANGHVNHVTEEEEEIMIDALIRAHSIDPTASASDSDGYTTATANDGYSTANTNTNDSFVSGYDSPRPYGGSSYVRTTAKSMASVNPRRKVTLSNASVPLRDAPSKHNGTSITFDTSAKQMDDPVGAGNIPFDAYLSNSTFSPAQIRRASLALQDAIQEFEEDEEDEKILAPRSGLRKGGPQEYDSHATHGESPVAYGEAIVWPNDQSHSGPHDTLGSTSVPYHSTSTSSPNYKMDTVNRLPGYVPGMHRPITPRDSAVDTDTNTGTSTPQPPSSMNTSTYEHSPSNVSSPGRIERGLPPSILLNKRASTTSSPLRTRPRELSNAEQYDGGGSSSDTTQVPLKSALSDKRRPTSPLVDSAYQSAIRSSTPSNNFMDTWSPTTVSFATSPSSRVTNSSSTSLRESHLRQASNPNSSMETSESYYSGQSQPRSAASPALPDSPTINGSSGLANIVSSWNGATTNVIVDEPIHRTSTPRLSTLDNGHTSQRVRAYSPHLRSGTPNTHTRRGGHSRSASLADTAPGRRSPRTSHTHSSSSGLRQNPLMMSPMLNSSRSSLASTGSSYHSWDEDQLGGKKPHKRGVSVFIDSDSAPWKKRQSGFDVDFGTENVPAPEDIKDVLAGLTVQDMSAVQEKLVSAAVKKRVGVPGVRPLSGQKRRRTSTGQSVGSMASPSEPGIASPPRVASPPPIVQTQPSDLNLSATLRTPSPPPTTKSAEDQAKKASALLHAMMDSIESSPHKPTSPPPATTVQSLPQPQALAPQASFSSEEPQSATPPSPADEPPTPDTPVPEQDPRQKALADALFGSDSDATVKDSHLGFGRSQSLRAFAMPPVVSSPPVQAKGGQQPAKERSKDDDQLLAEEIEQRAMAATAALKSPSTPRSNEASGATTNGRKAVKRLNTKQISSPQLVSSTTSVDTIALSAAVGSNPSTPISQHPPQLQQHAQSKLSQRIKKFTGNLRTRAPIPMGEEISPYVIEASTPPAAEQTQANPNTRTPPASDLPKSSPTSTPDAPSAVTPTLEEPVSSSVPGTPTSTQPRLRGFMARLRKVRKDSTDMRDKTARAPSPLGPNSLKTPIPPPPHIPAAMLKTEPVRMPDNLSSSSLAVSGVGVESAPPPPAPPPLSAPADLSGQRAASSHAPASSQQMDEDALRQLYDAASQLGLDKSAINDILVRSQSTSSRSTAWTQTSPSVPLSSSDTFTTPSPLPLASTLERTTSMTAPKPPRGSASLSRQLSLKPYLGTRPSRAPSTTPDDNSPAIQASVIRRTVIFPSPPGRVSAEMTRRLSTSKHRRTRSGSIHSNKSVQERAPTPPPSRAPASKRFSKEIFPPVPQLPSGVEGSVTSTLQVSRSGSAFGTTSNYDSLYEMYAENPGQQDPATSHEDGQNEQVHMGSAVEVLELSDGQVVWSIVDGLRAAGEDYEGDDIPAFPRLSRNSEYSAQDTHELRFREHQRTASKASTTSTMTKLGKQSQSNRPETRVYFSSAGDIGTLVDSLTKNTEAGQFNIIPGIPSAIGSLRPQSGAQSARSLNGSYNSSLPDGDWTLEERIDQMIAASRKRAGL